jgi:hypothetical protein
VYPPFVAFPIPLKAAVSDPLVKQACLESLFLFHMLFLSAQLKARELDSANPVVAEPMAGRPWPPVPSTEARLPKRQRDTAGGANRTGDRYRSLQERPSHILRTTTAMSPGTKKRLTKREGNRPGS